MIIVIKKENRRFHNMMFNIGKKKFWNIAPLFWPDSSGKIF